MRTLKINIEDDVYSILQPIATINLYKILHPKGSFEITRRRYTGEWKVLLQTNNSVTLPIAPIGKAIEENWVL
ncbi:hypothetical protein [Pedobacter cryoconitis]|uniref:Uncharacterized protein n=1 Tax=Pedobacter cryoconitis TaxID=188932 RepID=A0A327T7V3_9SPHI|nr:hypothetical protein [Pedobacter cryoconitis]RAJ37409.1 hypothetical protein LY11_00487 [Pedobacter cryoconitis]